MIESRKLPLQFDAARLQGALATIGDDAWIGHFNRRDYDGVWSGIALRGPAGATHPIQSLVAHPGITEWAATAVLEERPAFQEVLDALPCPLLSVRLLRLEPGAVIKEHTDDGLELDGGEVRLHVPVQTNPEVHFMLNGERVVLQPGELWYLNVQLPHSVVNGGQTPRVHMVIDCVVDDWVRAMLTGEA